MVSCPRKPFGGSPSQGLCSVDDDLDIAMPREDYDKFIKYAREKLEAPLSICTPEEERRPNTVKRWKFFLPTQDKRAVNSNTKFLRQS